MMTKEKRLPKQEEGFTKIIFKITVGETIQNNVGMSTRVYAIPYRVLLFFLF
jgi:hypothetical protein